MDKKYLCVTDLGLDKVFVYTRDLTINSIVNVPAGHGPRRIVFDDSGTYAFCLKELEFSVSLLTYQNGNFSLINTASALPAGFEGMSQTAAIRYNKE